MANEKNLRPPFSKDNPTIARESQKKAVEARRRNKRQREAIALTVDRVLNSKITDPKLVEKIKKSGVKTSGTPNFQDLLVASAITKDVKNASVVVLLKYAQLLGEDIKDQAQANGYLADLIDGLKEG